MTTTIFQPRSFFPVSNLLQASLVLTLFYGSSLPAEKNTEAEGLRLDLMAVLKIFEVNILVNGDPVTEYEEHDGNVRDKEVVKYIEVLASTEFALEFKIKPTYRFVEDYLSFDIYMDGKRVRSPVVERKDFEKQKQKQCGYSFVREDVTRQEGQDLVTRKFRFAGITTCEDSDYLMLCLRTHSS